MLDNILWIYYTIGMRVRFSKSELFIEPETEFEEEVLSQYHNCTATLKCGLSLSEIKGICIGQAPTKETEH